MREQADSKGVASIAIPRIGVGYGGLSWRKVRAIVEKVFTDWPGTLYVYEECAREGEGVTHADHRREPPQEADHQSRRRGPTP